MALQVTLKRFAPATLVALLTVGNLFLPSSASSLVIYSQTYAQVEHKAKVALLSQDMQALKDHDVVLVIDKSRSMLIEDCPRITDSENENAAPISRWNWCREQLLELAGQSKGALPDGFRVVVFSGTFSVYEHVDAPGVNMIFNETAPNGPTCAAAPIKDQLNRYFAQRNSAGDPAKPLVMAIITDGCPNDASSLRTTIADALRKVDTPNEVSITLLQVGHDLRAAKLLTVLNNLCGTAGLSNVVKARSFEEVQKIGLVHALSEAVGTKASAQAAPLPHQSVGAITHVAQTQYFEP